MKVGLVTTWAECGAGHVSLAYASILSASGCDVAIYSRGQYLRDQRWGVSSSRPWPLELDRSVDGLTRVDRNQFARWLRRYRPDWLLFNEQRAWAPVLQAREAGVRCAAYVDYYRADTVELFELYDALFCHTKRHYQVFSCDHRASFIPWGVDTQHFSPGVRQAEMKDSDAPLVVVHSAGMGGPSDRKGTDLALQAFQGTKGKAELLLHTQLASSRWPEAWHQAVSADPRIKVLEGTLDPVSLYRRGDLYLYPSRLEGIGLTLPEALSCGLAGITTDVPPMSEFIQHGVTGTLIPVEVYRGRSDGYYWPEAWVSLPSLVQCLQEYIDRPIIARQQGAKARQTMLSVRHWPDLGRNLLPLLNDTTQRTIHQQQLDKLIRRAKHQDRLHEPTPLDGMVQSVRLVVQAIKRRHFKGS